MALTLVQAKVEGAVQTAGFVDFFRLVPPHTARAKLDFEAVYLRCLPGFDLLFDCYLGQLDPLVYPP